MMITERIGDATLYFGDSREVIPTLTGLDCIVTSPPYNTLHCIPDKPSGSIWSDPGAAAWMKQLRENSYPDDLPEDDYIAQQNEVFASIAQVCNPTASLFYNHQLRWRDGQVSHPVRWFTPQGWTLRHEIVWDRGGGMMMNARMFARFDERILWFIRGTSWVWNQDCVGYGSVWRLGVAHNKQHPVAYPDELPRRCIAATTAPGMLVLDPYMGSATTGVACAQLGRRFVGIERERQHFDVACERVENAYRQQSLFAPQANATTQTETPTDLFT